MRLKDKKMDEDQFTSMMATLTAAFKSQQPAATTTVPNMKLLEVEEGDINENWKIFRSNFEAFMCGNDEERRR